MKIQIAHLSPYALSLHASFAFLELLASLRVGSILWGWLASAMTKLGREDLADRYYFGMRQGLIMRGHRASLEKYVRSTRYKKSRRQVKTPDRRIAESGLESVKLEYKYDAERIGSIVRRMDAWFESVRHPDGYAGPVVHWWRDCLSYAGAGLDWRYEGIILGYLNLFKATGRQIWMDKASRAGDDLVAGQLPGGQYRNSSFESNPQSGGNPHEAACDVGLFCLAGELKRQGSFRWEKYFLTAHRNLQAYILGTLWDAENHYFHNAPEDATFVPNKAATIAEALMLWEHLNQGANVLERFVIPTLDHILACQIRKHNVRFDGAIDQGWRGREGLGRYFPIYIARCIPALVEGFRRTGYERYRQAAWSALRFLLRERFEDGSFPQVIYSTGRINRYPQWIAGIGDVLRAMDLMAEEGMDISTEATKRWLLNGVLTHGGIRTANGVGSSLSQHPPSRPDFRDLISVCGWADKAFRYLTSKVGTDLQCEEGQIPVVEMACVFRGKKVQYRETHKSLECWAPNQRLYHWIKEENWADTVLT